MRTSPPSNAAKIILMSVALAVLLGMAYIGLYFFYLVPLEEAGQQIVANVGIETTDFSREIFYSDIGDYPPESIVTVMSGDETRYFVVDPPISEDQQHDPMAVAFD